MSANVESGRHASLIAAVEILVKEALAAKSAADQTVAALAKMYETTAASVKSENGLSPVESTAKKVTVLSSDEDDGQTALPATANNKRKAKETKRFHATLSKGKEGATLSDDAEIGSSRQLRERNATRPEPESSDDEDMSPPQPQRRRLLQQLRMVNDIASYRNEDSEGDEALARSLQEVLDFDVDE